MSERVLTELLRQPYADGVKYVAAGVIDGDPVEKLYLEFGREDDPVRVELRADEAATIVWALGGCLYSHLISTLTPDLDSATRAEEKDDE
jgi:hypothetical protein